MIDEDGFRLNVGMIVVNKQGHLLWARRKYMREAWQFPQGGIDENEQPQQAMYRELNEELGLVEDNVEILATSGCWYSYFLPKEFQRRHSKPLCVGQKQKWFLLQLVAHDHVINLATADKPEFDAWRWVEYWYPLDHIIDFKKEVYRQALQEFADLVTQIREGIS